VTIWAMGKPDGATRLQPKSPSPTLSFSLLERISQFLPPADNKNFEPASACAIDLSGPLGSADINSQRSVLRKPPPLPVSPHNPAHWNDLTIYVSIASYRDTELPHTLYSLFTTAMCPHRIHVGVVWQGDLPQDSDTLPLHPTEPSSILEAYKSNIRVMQIPSGEARGPCWARHLTQSLWRGEDMWLQIDSHMRFRGNWDSYLIQLWYECRGGDGAGDGDGDDPSGDMRFPVLTTYPLGYELPDVIPADVRPTLLVSEGRRQCGVGLCV